MSAQINLYHPRFLKQRELLSLGNVVIAALATYALLAALGGWAWQHASARRDAAGAVEAQLTAAKEQVDAATQAAAVRKPNSQLVADAERAETMLRRRGDTVRLLESGAIGTSGGFTEYMRGFARQVPEGLWLKGFTIGAGGDDMEIRGSIVNPSALPDFIRRLGTEKAFQGRGFAALTMNRTGPAAAVRPGAQGVVPAAVVAPTPAQPAPVDFLLTGKLVEAGEVRQ
jgi:hypothetical protein